jgi:tetratricopeptide (TPR) repeat protein
VVLVILLLPVALGTVLRKKDVERAAGKASVLSEARAAVAEMMAGRRRAGAKGVRRVLTWRSALLGAVGAFSLLGVSTSGYMGMRLLGIGPLGTLVAKGVLEPGERIILAEFENQTNDPLLAAAVTEAFRIGFDQTTAVRLVQSRNVSQALERMQTEPGTRLDEALAREVGVREGIRAVIAGAVFEAGPSYVISARLVSSESGEELARVGEPASDSTQIIPATDRVSRRLRELIGESLTTIRRNPPLPQVTTQSLEALRKYALATRAHLAGDLEEAISLLEEAVAIDTAFAMAYRRLGAAFANRGASMPRAREAYTMAYEHREHLTEREYLFVLAQYHKRVTEEFDKAAQAYEGMLELDPYDNGALVNLSDLHLSLRNYARAEEFARRTIEWDSAAAGWQAYWNALEAQANLGRFQEAEATLQAWADHYPISRLYRFANAQFESVRGNFKTAEAILRSGTEEDQARWSLDLFSLSLVQGKLTEAESVYRSKLAGSSALNYLGLTVDLAFVDTWHRGELERGLGSVDAALERYPLDELEPRSWLFGDLAALFALAGRLDRAHAMVAAHAAAFGPDSQPNGVLGIVALEEGRYQDAIAEFRTEFVPTNFSGTHCPICNLPRLGRAYDLAGESDSAIATYERYVTTPWWHRTIGAPGYNARDGSDAWWLGPIYERLGQLYEQRGDREKAIYYHGKLVELWKDADPELQPRVEAARRAMEALSPDR